MPRTLKKKRTTLAVKGDRKQPRRKVVPLFLTLPNHGGKSKSNDDTSRVWLASANLETLQVAARTRKPPQRGRLALYTLSSPTERLRVLQIASIAIQLAEELVLPKYGGRRWSCQATLQDNPNAWFVFDGQGRVQPATLPHLMPYNSSGNGKRGGVAAAKIPKFPKMYIAASLYDNDEDYDDYDVLANLPSAATVDPTDLDRIRDWIQDDNGCPVTALSHLAWTTDTMTRRLPLSLKWTSPLGSVFRTRSSAYAEAMALCKRQVTLDKVLSGVMPSGKLVPNHKQAGKRQALTVGKWRFERDGLWVVGQEESWRIERMMEHQLDGAADSLGTAIDVNAEKTTDMSPLALYIQSNRKSHQAMRLREMTVQAERVAVEAAAERVALRITEHSGESERDGATQLTSPDEGIASLENGATNVLEPAAVPAKVRFTLREAERELRGLWKDLSEEERKEWTLQCQGCDKMKAATNADTAKVADEPKSDERDKMVSPTSCTSDPAAPATPAADIALDTKQSTAIISPSPAPTEANALVSGSSISGSQRSSFFLPPQIAKQVDRASWRLNEEQIRLCYNAGIEHYEQIMRTVQLRDLHRELQDGFDLFRERGRGRYDMELPFFDEPQFNFLTDIKKAPWMPIVREILGKEVVVIHKGIFMSMPGAAPQPYHQDGLHLTRQYQKPCHAINVFVPLIDITMQHGPTEFCLGSHILGKEDLDRKFCVTPVVPAGTPIIFDYRLGHRGLANQSSTCRPIVYCTYASAADGKEFRDSVNFSRKRYRKIGDIVSKAPSRDERAKKRRLQFDDNSNEAEQPPLVLGGMRLD